MTTADGIRRRLARLGGADPVRVHFVDADETDLHRLPDGPEVLAEIAAIRVADPRAHIIQSVMVDGEHTRDEAAARLAALRAARAAEDEAPI